MNILTKNEWTNDNILDFYDILLSLKNDNKIEREKRIINTNKELLAISSSNLHNISKYIYKGNYISFLDIMPHKFHDALIVDAYLISKIKDYKLQKKYINRLSKYIDNWAVVDAIKFNIQGYEKEYINYSKELISSNKPMIRRIGVRILFSYVKDDKYIDTIFNIISSLKYEEAYYVNMCTSWLLCEMFIYHKNEVIKYLQSNNLNTFVINKTISKCRDSFRISDSDKELLLSLKIVK